MDCSSTVLTLTQSAGWKPQEQTTALVID